MTTLIRQVKKLIPEPIKECYRTARWRIPLLFRRWFRDDPSQAGEISAVRQLIRPDWPRVLIDIGANDGFFLSNSYPFVRDGWKALLVEPHPRVFERLQRRHARHPNAILERVGCGARAGTAELFMAAADPSGIYATICDDDNAFIRRAKTGATRATIPVDTLTNLLDKHQFPQDITLLSVDTEGLDYDVLVGLDWKRYRPRIVIVEEYDLNPQKFAARNQLFADQNYVMHQRVGCNSLWLDETLANQISPLQ